MTEAHATLENRTFDEIAVGDSAGVTKTLTRDEIALFTAVSGDINPIHLDERRAEASPLRRVVGHSLWGGRRADLGPARHAPARPRDGLRRPGASFPARETPRASTSPA